MKNKTKIAVALAMTVAFATVLYVQAGPTVIGVTPSSGAPVIDSTATTNLAVNFPAWPTFVATATSATNFTTVDVSRYNHVALQFCLQGTNSGGSAAVVWSIYKSVHPLSPTNSAGGNLDCDLLGYVTNVINGTTRVSSTASYSDVPRTTATSVQSTDPGIAGVTKLYVGWVTNSTSGGFTNYQVYVNGK